MGSKNEPIFSADPPSLVESDSKGEGGGEYPIVYGEISPCTLSTPCALWMDEIRSKPHLASVQQRSKGKGENSLYPDSNKFRTNLEDCSC